MTALETKIRNLARNAFIGLSLATSLNCYLSPDKRAINSIINSRKPTEIMHGYHFSTEDESIAGRYPNAKKMTSTTRQYYEIRGSITHESEIVDKIIEIKGDYAYAYVVEGDNCQVRRDEEKGADQSSLDAALKRYQINQMRFTRTSKGWRPSGLSILDENKEYEILKRLGLAD